MLTGAHAANAAILKRSNSMNTKQLFVLVFILSLLVFSILIILQEKYLPAIMLHFMLFSLSMFFLCGKDLKETLVKLGVFINPLREIKLGVLGFFAIIFITIALNVLLNFAGFNDAQNVLDKIGEFPFYLLVFAVLLAPVSEELFFRALLTNKFGILPAAIVFALSHFVYGSVVQIIGAFAIGLFLGWLYKYSKSIVAVIIPHLLLNLTSLIMAKTVYGV